MNQVAFGFRADDPKLVVERAIEKRSVVSSVSLKIQHNACFGRFGFEHGESVARVPFLQLTFAGRSIDALASSFKVNDPRCILCLRVGVDIERPRRTVQAFCQLVFLRVQENLGA